MAIVFHTTMTLNSSEYTWAGALPTETEVRLTFGASLVCIVSSSPDDPTKKSGSVELTR